ncbi:MAG TPA: hypothetical protein VJV74_05910 [Terriglobia bacterium]|nr:hypothetical protein [Terriglobia bacterium]
MRRLAIYLALAAIAAAACQPLRGEDEAAVRKQIEANYEKMKKAVMSHSVDAINQCRKQTETDDGIFIDRKGDIYPYHVMGPDYESFAKSFISYEYTIKKLTISGNEADVWIDVKEKRTQTGRRSIRSTEVRQRQFTVVEHTKDTWTKTPEGWKRRLREEIAPAEISVDGEPGAPPATK